MKTIRISDEVHAKLTGLLGTLTAQTGKIQTYTDVIEALLSKSVILPSELLDQATSFISKNRQLGYTTKEELVRDAIRFRISWLSEEYMYVKIPIGQYSILDRVVRETGAPHDSVEVFVNEQIKKALDKYHKREKRKYTHGDSE
ncbi:MAG: hypothetical protein QXZ70_01005 [Candidatus Bathyarchaeia archaeon]